MTTQEVTQLAPGTVVYLPTSYTLKRLLYYGRVGVNDYYTFSYAPDENGQMDSRKPIYLHALELLPLVLEEAEGWRLVADELEKQLDWIRVNKLSEVVGLV